jgi:hypothetical protein
MSNLKVINGRLTLHKVQYKDLSLYGKTLFNYEIRKIKKNNNSFSCTGK